MINAILKTKFEKFEPKKSIYRNFKQYDSEQFKLDICNSMFPMRTHAAFEKKFNSILGKHAAKKTKILRVNQKHEILKMNLKCANVRPIPIIID